MENAAVAALLRQIGDILDYQGVQFKPAAYRRAAQTIEDLTTDIASFKDKKALKELPGVGEAIADKILEYFKTGRMSFLDALKAETQMGAAGLLAVDDLGPKRVRELEKLGILTVPQLIEAAEKGKLRDLPRFSELLEKKILESAKRSGDRVKRFNLKDVEPDVKVLVATLAKIKGAIHVEAAGSFRRRKETVGDVDVLIAVKKASIELAESIHKAIAKLPIVERIVASGPTRIAFDLKSGMRTDIRIVEEKQWGSALLYFTGSKEHNISLRRRAIDRGMKLSEYALFKNDKVVASKTEQDIYKALELPFIEPDKRVAELPA